MKRLSICLPAITLTLILTLSGATPIAEAAGTNSTPSAKNTHYQYYYYWYGYPADSFIDYQSLQVEELEYWIWYGWLVNTDPRGGTLIARGYLINTYPHVTFPSAYLYRH
ncbi:MAG TPA: hypothetical protein VGM89_20335 [Puia sp.]|jgi:hypothetical protein